MTDLYNQITVLRTSTISRLLQNTPLNISYEVLPLSSPDTLSVAISKPKFHGLELEKTDSKKKKSEKKSRERQPTTATERHVQVYAR